MIVFVIFGIVAGILDFETWTAIAGVTIWFKFFADFVLSRHAHPIVPQRKKLERRGPGGADVNRRRMPMSIWQAARWSMPTIDPVAPVEPVHGDHVDHDDHEIDQQRALGEQVEAQRKAEKLTVLSSLAKYPPTKVTPNHTPSSVEVRRRLLRQ